MKKLLSSAGDLLAAVLLLSGPLAVAQEPENSVKEVTKKVLQAVDHYARGISCVDGESADASGIAALTPFSEETPEDAEFLVFWRGDVGCRGGSATLTTNASLVKVGAYNYFFVASSWDGGGLDFDTHLYPDVIGNTKDTVIIEVDEHANGDGSCCPSERYRMTLKLDKKGTWKAIKRKKIPLN